MAVIGSGGGDSGGDGGGGDGGCDERPASLSVLSVTSFERPNTVLCVSGGG